jgi:hypothetical protein
MRPRSSAWGGRHDQDFQRHGRLRDRESGQWEVLHRSAIDVACVGPRVLSRLLPEVPEPLGVHLRVALRVLDVHLAQVLLHGARVGPLSASRGVLSKR